MQYTPHRNPRGPVDTAEILHSTGIYRCLIPDLDEILREFQSVKNQRDKRFLCLCKPSRFPFRALRVRSALQIYEFNSIKQNGGVSKRLKTMGTTA